MSNPSATTIMITPSKTLASDGINAESSNPTPKPKKLCIIACGVKHDFIFAFIYKSPPFIPTLS